MSYITTYTGKHFDPTNPDADYALYQADLAHAAQFILKPGNFAVFLPEEAHLPSCGNGEAVVKAVVKIHKSRLNG